MIMFIVILIGGLAVWFLTATQPNDRTKPNRRPKPNHHPKAVRAVVSPLKRTVSAQKFQQLFLDYHQVLPPGTLVVVQPNPRVVGAMIDLTPQMLRTRMQLIKDQTITRDQMARKQALVPGFDQVKGEWLDGKPLYHRTHLIPFAMGLSEGNDCPGLLMTGTAYLNHGDRIQTGFLISNKEQAIRGDRLYHLYARHWRLNLTKPWQIKATKYPSLNYSLDDIERLATHIILSHQKNNASFRYQVRPLYQNDSLIPTAVQVQLIDQTYHQWLINVVLPNIK